MNREEVIEPTILHSTSISQMKIGKNFSLKSSKYSIGDCGYISFHKHKLIYSNYL